MVAEKPAHFAFPDCGELPLPILHIDDVSFSYSGKAADMLYRNLDLSVDLDSRIALVGPNGAGIPFEVAIITVITAQTGKSTLLKLMCGDITPVGGMIKRNPHLRIGRYYQHSIDQLGIFIWKAPSKKINAMTYYRYVGNTPPIHALKLQTS